MFQAAFAAALSLNQNQQALLVAACSRSAVVIDAPHHNRASKLSRLNGPAPKHTAYGGH